MDRLIRQVFTVFPTLSNTPDIDDDDRGRRLNREDTYFVRDHGIGFFGSEVRRQTILRFFQRLHDAEQIRRWSCDHFSALSKHHGGRVWAEAELNRALPSIFGCLASCLNVWS